MHDRRLIIGNNRTVCEAIRTALTAAGVDAVTVFSESACTEGELQKILLSAEDRLPVLVLRNEELKAATEVLHRCGQDVVFVCPWDTHYTQDRPLDEWLIETDNRKPRLDYLEVEISNCCNLNCKGCSEFSNLVCEDTQVDFDGVRRDLEKLKDFFWGVGKIRLLGGEPLTNPDFPSFVEMARHLYPDCDLRIVTNGLLIPTLDDGTLARIQQSNCALDISNYPPTKKMLKRIRKRLEQAGISYTVSMPVRVFFKLFLPEPLESPNDSYNNCLFTHCHCLGGGFLSACSHQFWVRRLNSAFDLAYPEDEKIDIHNTSLSGWEIDALFKKPLDFCRYCPKGMVPFKWKPCPEGQAKPEDWIIRHTVVNDKVLPVTQKVFKFVTSKLRRSLQSPKHRRS